MLLSHEEAPPFNGPNRPEKTPYTAYTGLSSCWSSAACASVPCPAECVPPSSPLVVNIFYCASDGNTVARFAPPVPGGPPVSRFPLPEL